MPRLAKPLAVEGSRDLKAAGETAGHQRVARLMRAAGLQARKRRPHTSKLAVVGYIWPLSLTSTPEGWWVGQWHRSMLYSQREFRKLVLFLAVRRPVTPKFTLDRYF